MKIQIIGNGSFGNFLKELLVKEFEIVDEAESVILAVPFSAYDEVSKNNSNKHLINVCSIQKPSTDICLKYSPLVTSIHPLFGKRTPSTKRNSILTYKYTTDGDKWQSNCKLESEFLKLFSNVSNIIQGDKDGKKFTTESHDFLMSKTHVAAIKAARQLRVYVEGAADIPDEFIPNSFRLMRDFVKTLDDMPKGTLDSIMSNPFIKED